MLQRVSVRCKAFETKGEEGYFARRGKDEERRQKQRNIKGRERGSTGGLR